MTKHVLIVKKRWLPQKWHGRFKATNGRTLAHTENYKNQADLERMLTVYFPDWEQR